jgi:hypothetical protein
LEIVTVGLTTTGFVYDGELRIIPTVELAVIVVMASLNEPSNRIVAKAIQGECDYPRPISYQITPLFPSASEKLGPTRPAIVRTRSSIWSGKPILLRHAPASSGVLASQV